MIFPLRSFQQPAVTCTRPGVSSGHAMSYRLQSELHPEQDLRFECCDQVARVRRSDHSSTWEASRANTRPKAADQRSETVEVHPSSFVGQGRPGEAGEGVLLRRAREPAHDK